MRDSAPYSAFCLARAFSSFCSAFCLVAATACILALVSTGFAKAGWDGDARLTARAMANLVDGFPLWTDVIDPVLKVEMSLSPDPDWVGPDFSTKAFLQICDELERNGAGITRGGRDSPGSLIDGGGSARVSNIPLGRTIPRSEAEFLRRLGFDPNKAHSQYYDNPSWDGTRDKPRAITFARLPIRDDPEVLGILNGSFIPVFPSKRWLGWVYPGEDERVTKPRLNMQLGADGPINTFQPRELSTLAPAQPGYFTYLLIGGWVDLGKKPFIRKSHVEYAGAFAPFPAAYVHGLFVNGSAPIDLEGLNIGNTLSGLREIEIGGVLCCLRRNDLIG